MKDNLGIVDHEYVGANYLKEQFTYFPDEVIECVKHHVNAKRYLLFKNNNYIHNLSQASIETLKQQNGIMSEYEAHEFEKNPYIDKILLMRKYDDLGKNLADLESSDKDFFKQLIQNQLLLYIKEIK